MKTFVAGFLIAAAVWFCMIALASCSSKVVVRDCRFISNGYYECKAD